MIAREPVTRVLMTKRRENVNNNAWQKATAVSCRPIRP